MNYFMQRRDAKQNIYLHIQQTQQNDYILLYLVKKEQKLERKITET